MNEACQAELDLEVIENDIVPEPAETKKTAPELSPDRIASGLTCLIAEDHPVNQKLLRIFVENFGASVITADDGQQAIDAVKNTEHIDIVFMDIQMPVVNGIEATRTIRKYGYRGIIIACTANADKDDNNEYLKAGMDDVLIKPFKKIQIQETFEKWLPNLEILDELPAAEDSAKNDSGWNISELMESVSNDKNLALELVTHFIEQTKSLLLKAREALASGNYKSLSRIARSLKSSAFTVYATKLFKLAEELEIASKAADFDRITEKMNQFTYHFSALNDTAQEHTNSWHSSEK
jgi:CheY-like chemotaxis protein/HPt (histidine-containing phosphotransfer) domain-containing protein